MVIKRIAIGAGGLLLIWLYLATVQQKNEQSESEEVFSPDQSPIKEAGIRNNLSTARKRPDSTLDSPPSISRLSLLRKLREGRNSLRDAEFNSFAETVGIQAVEVLSPRDAAVVIAELVGTVCYDDLAIDLSKKFGTLDVSGGLSWFAALSESARAPGIASALGTYSDPVQLLEELDSASLDLTQRNIDELRSSALASVGKVDLERALGLVRDSKLDTVLVENSVEVAIGNAIASNNVSSALATYELSTDLIGTDKTTRAIVTQWASRQPEQMAAWCTENPAHPIAIDGIGSLITKMARNDAYKASKWLTELPPCDMRDRGIVSLARSLLSTNPSDALTWLEAINNPQPEMQMLKLKAEARLKQLSEDQ